MKKTVEFISAGITAFLVLNIFCFAYYNVPVHFTTRTGATDYVWEKHAYYSKMTEGFGYGRMNNEGFNNLEDYDTQPIDILMMGSSHMEGTNVPQNLTAAALLNELFDGSKYIYNIAISGHNFPHIVNNIEMALQYYKPDEYIIIEINTTQFSVQDLEAGISGTLKRIPSYDNKLIILFQKMPYLRLLYSQYKNFTGNGEEESPDKNSAAPDKEKYSTVLGSAMKKLAKASMEHDVGIIIFYHHYLIFDNNDLFLEDTAHEYSAIFENACRSNGITFINMESLFLEEYNRNNELPHGFSNTAIGVGHLNKNGHRLIAGELFRQINSDSEGLSRSNSKEKYIFTP
jgi:hypothetical protein